MRFSFIIGCLLILGSCQNDSEIKEKVTGIVMEVEPNQLELDEIALLEQPETVQDFFALDNGSIGDDYCYDYNALSQLILFENDVDGNWKQFEISDNYLTAYHAECCVLLEFMTFDLRGEKRAFFSQMTKNSQQFDYLKWNVNTERWNKINQYPHPALGDYFKNLDAETAELVHEYGTENCYINPKSESVTFLFSEWGTLMNMGEKQLLEFNEKPDFYYELETVDEKLQLSKVPILYPDQKH
jgi:hypothetical protein